MNDLAQALRMLRRNRGFTVAAVGASLHCLDWFGARPVLGRTFTVDEGRPGGAPVLPMS